MNFIIEKDEFLMNLKIVEKASVQKAIQPVLSNILIEAEENSVKFCATDLDTSIVSTACAKVNKTGKITLPARTLLEIASKIPNLPVEFLMNQETQVVKIICGSANFDIVGISADEFPINVEQLENVEGFSKVQIESKTFIEAIKKTGFAAANFEAKNIISGVFCAMSENELEMAATDGNRLSVVSEKIEGKINGQMHAVIPARTLAEVQRISGLCEKGIIEIYIDNVQIIFRTGDVFLLSRLIEGQYPPYKQLIPASFEKTLVAKREELISAFERVAIMVSEKMNTVKLRMCENKLYLKADTPSEGMSEDVIDIIYDFDEMSIAFNYRYIVECLKVMDTENVKIGLNGSLSSAVFRPETEDNYLCLIMPIQMKQD